MLVPAATFTNALMIKVLLARADHVMVKLGCSTLFNALAGIATVSAVVVQSGATVVFAVTVVHHTVDQLALDKSLGSNIYCVLYWRLSGM